MKNFLKYLLQSLLGLKNYLFIFSIFCIWKVKNGKYEQEFLHFMRLVPPKGIVLDLGANIGITAVPLAQKYPDIELHAYEPIPENFNALSSVVKWSDLKNIRLFNFALGDREGFLDMIMPVRGKARMQGLCTAYDKHSDEKGIIYKVPVKRLDDLYKDKNIVAIKIDVENFEYEVLEGSRTLLSVNKPVIYCELWNNEKRKLVFDLVRSLDYEIFTYDGALKTLVPLKNETTSKINFFFT